MLPAPRRGALDGSCVASPMPARCLCPGEVPWTAPVWHPPCPHAARAPERRPGRLLCGIPRARTLPARRRGALDGSCVASPVPACCPRPGEAPWMAPVWHPPCPHAARAPERRPGWLLCGIPRAPCAPLSCQLYTLLKNLKMLAFFKTFFRACGTCSWL
nr:DBF4-type zinc finger-containing protein 2 homolog [Pan troglodytes]